MSKGGARKGAGRPAGVPNKITQEAIDKATSLGVLPLDVLLEGMHFYYNLSKINPDGFVVDASGKLIDSYRSAAKDYAIAAAPYVHPKLSAVQANVTLENHEKALKDLD
jgi:hypothetical protein